MTSDPIDAATEASLDETVQDKRELRRRLRSELSGRSGPIEPEVAAPDRMVVAHLGRFLGEHVPPPLVVVIYDAIGHELDLTAIVDQHPNPVDRFALTRTPSSGRSLTIHRWDGERERHRYGYDQPRADAPLVDDGAIGAVVVPGLGFDRRGHRLGRGAGYYDRFLARLADSVLRIGVVAGPVLDSVPVEETDVAMTHLATSAGVLAVPIETDRSARSVTAG